MEVALHARLLLRRSGLTVRLNLRGYKVAYAPEISLERSTLATTARTAAELQDGPTAACKPCERTARRAEKQTVKPGGEVVLFHV